MNIRELSLLERTATWIEDLIEACRRLKPLYSANPKLAAEVSRTAKALRTSLHAFQAFLNDPEKHCLAPARKGKKKSLRLRLAFEAPLYELVRVVGYQGLPDPIFWEQYRRLCNHFGQPRMSAAVDELIWFDRSTEPAATARLKPEVLPLCLGLLGPPPS